MSFIATSMFAVHIVYGTLIVATWQEWYSMPDIKIYTQSTASLEHHQIVSGSLLVIKMSFNSHTNFMTINYHYNYS